VEEDYYVLIDPPITAFSKPEKIVAWIEELRTSAAEPKFQGPIARKCFEAALADAERDLEFSRTRVYPQHGEPPDSPAA
jgi:hypothetical protein